MKKYTEVLKKAKVYFYLYCPNCDQVFIDDLFYLAVQKRCPICGRTPLVIRGKNPMTEKQVRQEVTEYLKKEAEKQTAKVEEKQSKEIRNMIMKH